MERKKPIRKQPIRRRPKKKKENRRIEIDLNNKKVLALIIAIVVLIILLQSYFKILNKYRNDRIFALESEKSANEVANPVFKLDKIMMYSGANVEDLSESQNLSDINVSQFTDFAIYIDNTVKDKKLSEENTINKIYIDNIAIGPISNSSLENNQVEELGTKKFGTKSIDSLGKYVPIAESSKQIDFNVIHKNSDKDKIEGDNKFFTDCSEPLILSYVNENIVQNKDVSSANEKLSLDGGMLRYLNIDLNTLSYKISFTVNIENNLGEKFECKCSTNVDLGSGDGNGIYSRIYYANC